jgi:uncharacterized membrane protein
MVAFPALTLILSLLSCGASAADPPTLGTPEDSAVPIDTACAHTPGVTWSNWGHGFFATYCDGCHALTARDRNGAPETVTFDSLTQVRDQAHRIWARTLDDLDMPPGGGVLSDDLWLLTVFLDCGL